MARSRHQTMGRKSDCTKARVNMSKHDEDGKKQINYYGKKLYSLNPLLARRKPMKEGNPDYSKEEEPADLTK